MLTHEEVEKMTFEEANIQTEDFELLTAQIEAFDIDFAHSICGKCVHWQDCRMSDCKDDLCYRGCVVVDCRFYQSDK